MLAWWLDRVLPGLVVTAITTLPALWIQHRATVRRVTGITDRQTTELLAHEKGDPEGPPRSLRREA